MNISDPNATIARALISSAPPGWSKLWTSGEVGDDYSDLEFGYSSDAKEINWLMPDQAENNVIHNALKALRVQMSGAGQQPWSRCNFTVFPDGHFKFDVSYDD